MRETLLVVNLQAKVASSHIGANHLPTLRGRINASLGERTEIKKIKKTHIICKHSRSHHNQQFPFQKHNNK